MEAYHHLSTPLTTFEGLIAFKKFPTRVQCVIFYGRIPMTAAGGEYRLEVPGTLLAKTFPRPSITITD
jgi:hypothetical protein